MTSLVASTLPSALRGARSRSVMTALRGLAGSSAMVALAVIFST
jgi:hypothetical protein